ncbi:MAG TPA: hypothetical protein VNX65_02475 [Patescibacteria group bacterium]|jgi:hypothetical protein|nr:hypothetical protein [Patescibacteria group bacterium]
MKRLILIKQSNSFDLAHLYEHIFYTHIEELFYKKHLFQYLDYSLVGKTLYGTAYLDLELYAEPAIILAKEIPNLTIRLDKDNIAIAASQILAEEEAPLSSLGYETVRQALIDLHNQTWQNADNIELIDTKKVRKTTRPAFYIAEGKSLPARKLQFGVTLNKDFVIQHRVLIPLFRQFAWLIMYNIHGALSDRYGYYSTRENFKSTKKVTGLFNAFKVADAYDNDVRLSNNLEACQEVIQSLRQYDAFTRHMSVLRNISYYNRPNLAPSFEENYEDTHILIGPKGWQKIATQENYELLMKHMSIELKFGHKKVSQRIVN